MILLLAYYSYNINNNLNIFNSPINTVEDLRGKSLTEAIKWANKNNINLDTDFEYSDMVEEYKIISQDKDFDSSLKKINCQFKRRCICHKRRVYNFDYSSKH